MHKRLQNQLQEIYGEEFDLSQQDSNFIQFIKVVEESYFHYEKEEKSLEHTLEMNAKKLEKSNHLLYQKQELLKSVENSMEDAVFYKDLEHKYIGCNAKFADFLGLTEQEIIGKSDFDFFTPSIAQHYYDTNEDIIKNKTKILYKHWITFNEKKLYILTSKTPLIDKTGKVIGIVGMGRDITHEFQLQQDLEHKNIMLIQQNKLASMGEMITNIAHQWRQPLNTLTLLIQKLGIFYKEELLTQEKVDTYISEAMFLTQEMSETIDDFRNFFSPTKRIEEFYLKEIILKAQTILKPNLKGHNIQFHIKMNHNYSITSYKNEFFQVILNLLNNAVEALIADNILAPKISIHIEKEDDNIILSIYDNAQGIQSSLIQKIFDPYFTTKEKGTGIGLYMSKIIIEEHMQGKLSVQSNYLGTTFTIILKELLN